MGKKERRGEEASNFCTRGGVPSQVGKITYSKTAESLNYQKVRRRRGRCKFPPGPEGFAPLFSKGSEMSDPTSSKNPPEDRPTHQSEGSKKIHKKPKTDDAIFTITEDSFISFRKKVHFPNDLVMKVPARSDRAHFSPLGYVTVYEFSLRAGLRLPPAPKFIDILMICGNGWNLQEKWEKLKELLVPLHIGPEDLLKILKLPDLDALQYKVRYLSRYIDEEYLFKVGLSTQVGRSYAQMLKKSVKVPEAVPHKNHSKRPGSEEDLQAPKKKKVDEILTVVSKSPRISPSKSYIPEDVLKHQCVGRRRAEELAKYLHGEYKKKYDAKIKEMKAMKEQLAECRTELDNMITSASLHNQQMDDLHIELVDAQTTINQQMKDQQILEYEKKRLQSLLSEKEAQQLPSTVIEEFKKSFAFKIIIEDHIQEAHNHIYDVEEKALEAECMEKGFIRVTVDVFLAEEDESLLEDVWVELLQALADLVGEELPPVAVVLAVESLTGVEGSRYETPPSFEFSLIGRVPRFLLQLHFAPHGRKRQISVVYDS
ncbi:hypothetical protein M5K25_027081 [Dendrobium thyrsiflorum]|uniref:Uncharacterized protein n=1 Tax=Dendrobium thyrsiflorum TaxID=117978 RepID=A0ABD0TZA1_DENTH